MLKLVVSIVVALQIDTLIATFYVMLIDRRARKVLKRRFEKLHEHSKGSDDLDIGGYA